MKVKSFLHKHKSTILTITLLLAVRWSFADQYRVPTGSMEPTVHVGDHIAVNKMAYDFKIPFTNFTLAHTREPQRGDIVVFKFPLDPSVNYVKRLVGLPGDHLVIENEFIMINGQAVPVARTSTRDSYFETWRGHKVLIPRNPKAFQHEKIDLIVPEGQYFFMGDNRDNSYDSRYWGFVPRENIKGRALFVLWNVSLNNYVPHSELDRFGHKLM